MPAELGDDIVVLITQDVAPPVLDESGRRLREGFEC
jgi:hypothetical protein